MKKVITDEAVPIKLWLDDLEDSAWQQVLNLTRLPNVFHHVAIMPDAHMGYGMPIGGVLALTGAVCPNAVGVDIGCGMSFVSTDIKEWQVTQIQAVKDAIKRTVPVGFSHHQQPQNWDGFDRAPVSVPVIAQELASARNQLGTLGGGNHFIELQKDETGCLCATLHSGSRNFGLKIAKAFHALAVKNCKLWHTQLPCSDLAFLPLETDEAQAYISAMTYALEFALESRRLMMAAVLNAIADVFTGVTPVEAVNIHHNYARMEQHFGASVMVHRKGATSARAGEFGVIPGSQGTASYVVRGLGNTASFMSCSHGAGRAMGREQAKARLSLETEVSKLNAAGILHDISSTKDLEEAAGAYKDIDIVMANQSDLVEVVHTLQPLAVVKG